MSRRAGRRRGSGGPSRLALPALVAALLGGLACATADSPRSRWDPDSEVLPLRQPPPPAEEPRQRSMVILLPEQDGSVGVIEVSNASGSATLSRPREGVAFEDLENPFIADDEQVRFAGQPTLDAEPQAPQEFTVFFRSGGARLTAESAAGWRAIAGALAARSVPEVTISAHADREGSEAYNMALSERRAKRVREALVEAGLDAELIELVWYGESRPAVATADGVSEPRNRRAVLRVR